MQTWTCVLALLVVVAISLASAGDGGKKRSGMKDWKNDNRTCCYENLEMPEGLKKKWDEMKKKKDECNGKEGEDMKKCKEDQKAAWKAKWAERKKNDPCNGKEGEDMKKCKEDQKAAWKAKWADLKVPCDDMKKTIESNAVDAFKGGMTKMHGDCCTDGVGWKAYNDCCEKHKEKPDCKPMFCGYIKPEKQAA